MANERLKQALQQADLTHEQFAEILAVDPKTVQRWIAARTTPYARHRAAIARALDIPEHELWPDITDVEVELGTPATSGLAPANAGDVIDSWGRSTAVRGLTYDSFIAAARESIDVLDSRSNMLRAAGVTDALLDRAGAGVRLRVVVNEPMPQLNTLGTVAVRIDPNGFLHTVLRRDDEMIVALAIVRDGQPPILHLKRLTEGGLFDALSEHFEAIWSEAAPLEPADNENSATKAAPPRRWPGREK